MSRWKVSFCLEDLSQARTATTLLSDLVEPAPDAATCFEEPDPGPIGTPTWDAPAHRVEAYFAERPDVAGIEAVLGPLLGNTPLAIDVVEVPDLNWVTVSQSALPPVSAGRFTVHGAHDRSRIGRGPWRIEIDAGEAFGTAHHATTAGCLAAIDRLPDNAAPRKILDLGCGSAVLAIAAARRWRRAEVLATDIDPVAIDVATANIRLNGMVGRIDTKVKSGLAGGRHDLVLANILAGPLVHLAKDVARATRSGAHVVLSGLLVTQAAEVIAAYVACGFALVNHHRNAGWSTLVLVNRGGRRAGSRRAG